ncbi:MAG TPA: hypothetical protein VGH88_11000 [Streptosporangiaceae bacterium]|jgi:hypothetical protein
MTEPELGPDDRRQPGGVAGHDERGVSAGTPGSRPPGDSPAQADERLVAGDDGSVVPLAEGLPDTGGATLRDVDPAYGRRDVTGTPSRGRPEEDSA